MTHIFIINPDCAHSRLTDDLRERLSRISGLNYYVFTTRYAGYETEIVRKVLHFFRGEKLRFYCCGGSGTMRNMLNGFDDLSEAEVAFYPCGMTNDFLKMFGSDEKCFENIEELINGDVIKVDYIRSNFGVALNTISLGLDSEMEILMDDYRFLRIFSEPLPYSAAIVHAIFFSKQQSYDIEADGQLISGIATETIFGNGNILGGSLHFTDHSAVSDGKGGFMSAPKLSFGGKIKMFTALLKNRREYINQICSCGEFRKFSIRRTDGSEFMLNFDGELQSCTGRLEARIVHKGLKFVVPKGITGGDGDE